MGAYRCLIILIFLFTPWHSSNELHGAEKAHGAKQAGRGQEAKPWHCLWLCTEETETQGRSKKGQECPFPPCVSKHQKSFWSRAVPAGLAAEGNLGQLSGISFIFPKHVLMLEAAETYLEDWDNLVPLDLAAVLFSSWMLWRAVCSQLLFCSIAVTLSKTER